MTYPPANPGYPAPPPGYGSPAGSPAGQPPVQQRMPLSAPGAAGTGKSPAYLTIAVAALGFLSYLLCFGTIWNGEFTPGPGLWQAAALVAGLLAAISALPRAAKSYTAVTAVLAVAALLLAVYDILNPLGDASAGWALWLILLVILMQAATALTALLFETGLLTAPPPRPQPSPYAQYGPPPGGYYGQPGRAQAPGYPGQYGGAYGAPAAGYGQADNTDTPPTGFPAYTPPSSGSALPSEPLTDPASGSGSGAAPGSTQP
jgi:hypothetical protein